MVQPSLAFTPTATPAYADEDDRAYAVLLDGREIGTVRSRRTESWRTLPSGVRYGLRGRPKHWEAYRPNGQRVGHRYDTRGRAASELIERGERPR